MTYFGMHDYIYISDEYTVLGRISTVDYGSSEKHGMRLGQAYSLKSACELAEKYTHEFMKYGIRFSEKLNING